SGLSERFGLAARMRSPTIETCDWRPCGGTGSSTHKTKMAAKPPLHNGAACSTRLDRKSWRFCDFFVIHNSCARAVACRFPVPLHFSVLPRVRRHRSCSVLLLFLSAFLGVIHESIASGESVSKSAQNAPGSQHEHFLRSRRRSGSTRIPSLAGEWEGLAGRAGASSSPVGRGGKWQDRKSEICGLPGS